jgi:hypothetical protein
VDRGSDNPVVSTGSIGGFHKKKKRKRKHWRINGPISHKINKANMHICDLS